MTVSRMPEALFRFRTSGNALRRHPCQISQPERVQGQTAPGPPEYPTFAAGSPLGPDRITKRPHSCSPSRLPWAILGAHRIPRGSHDHRHPTDRDRRQALDQRQHDGHKMKRRGPFPDADTAGAMADRLAAVCRSFHWPVHTQTAPTTAAPHKR